MLKECMLAPAGTAARNTPEAVAGTPQPEQAPCTVCDELFDARLQREVRRVAPQVDMVVKHATILAHGRQGSYLMISGNKPTHGRQLGRGTAENSSLPAAQIQ